MFCNFKRVGQITQKKKKKETTSLIKQADRPQLSPPLFNAQILYVVPKQAYSSSSFTQITKHSNKKGKDKKKNIEVVAELFFPSE